MSDEILPDCYCNKVNIMDSQLEDLTAIAPTLTSDVVSQRNKIGNSSFEETLFTKVNANAKVSNISLFVYPLAGSL